MPFPKHAIYIAKSCMHLTEIIIEFHTGKNKCSDTARFREEEKWPLHVAHQRLEPFTIAVKSDFYFCSLAWQHFNPNLLRNIPKSRFLSLFSYQWILLLKLKLVALDLSWGFFLSNEVMSRVKNLIFLYDSLYSRVGKNLLVWLLIFYLTKLKACVTGTGYRVGNHILCLWNYCFIKNLVNMKYNNSNKKDH